MDFHTSRAPAHPPGYAHHQCSPWPPPPALHTHHCTSYPSFVPHAPPPPFPGFPAGRQGSRAPAGPDPRAAGLALCEGQSGCCGHSGLVHRRAGSRLRRHHPQGGVECNAFCPDPGLTPPLYPCWPNRCEIPIRRCLKIRGCLQRHGHWPLQLCLYNQSYFWGLAGYQITPAATKQYQHIAEVTEHSGVLYIPISPEILTPHRFPCFCSHCFFVPYFLHVYRLCLFGSFCRGLPIGPCTTHPSMLLNSQRLGGELPAPLHH